MHRLSQATTCGRSRNSRTAISTTADQHVVGTFGWSELNISARSSNRWEEQYHLGLDEGADIPYGPNPKAPSAHSAELKLLVEEFGERVVASQIGVSRNTLRRILSGGNQSTSRRVLRQIAAATHTLSGERTDRLAASSRLREVAQAETRKIGLAELARRLGSDASNLRKAINGRREFGFELQRAARRYRPGHP